MHKYYLKRTFNLLIFVLVLHLFSCNKKNEEQNTNTNLIVKDAGNDSDIDDEMFADEVNEEEIRKEATIQKISKSLCAIKNEVENRCRRAKHDDNRVFFENILSKLKKAERNLKIRNIKKTSQIIRDIQEDIEQKKLEE